MTMRARASSAAHRGPRRQRGVASRRACGSFIGLALVFALGCAFELADVVPGASVGDGTGDGGGGGGEGSPNQGDGAGADAAAGDAGSPRGALLGAACPQVGSGKVVARLAVTPANIYAVCDQTIIDSQRGASILVVGSASGGSFQADLAFSPMTVARVGASVVIAGNGLDDGGGGVYGFFRPNGSLITPGNTGWTQMASTGSLVLAGGLADDGLWLFDSMNCVPPDGGQTCATEIGYVGETVGIAVSGTTVLHYGVRSGVAKLWVGPLDGSAKANQPIFQKASASRGPPLGVAAVAGQAYFALNADLLTCPLSVTSCASQTYVAGEAAGVVLVTADSKRPIWATGSKVRYADAPNAAKTLAESPGETITALVAEDGFAYWGTDQGNIYRLASP